MKPRKKMSSFVPIIVIIVVLVVGVGMFFGFNFIPYKGEKPDEILLIENVFNAEEQYAATLDMGDKDEFVILNLADIQIEDLKLNKHKPTFKMLDKLIQATKPDLITLTGDQVSGVFVRYTLKKICKFLDGYGIPWAPVLGNHDGQWNVTRNGNGDIYLSGKYKNVIFRKNDPSLGVGNYIINIARNSKSVHTVFMIDSHDSRTYDSGKDYDYNCKSLESVHFGSSVKKIYQAVFQWCDNLTSVEFSNSIEYIGAFAFNSCNLNGTIVLPSSLTQIGNRAFGFNVDMEKVYIPKSVKIVDDYVFDNSGEWITSGRYGEINSSGLEIYIKTGTDKSQWSSKWSSFDTGYISGISLIYTW